MEEEDIKVLEELKENFIFNNLSMTREEQKRTVYAINNILKRYKELEEENKKLNNMYKKEYHEHMEMKRQNGVLRNNERILKDNCIPISVIQNKIKQHIEIKETLGDQYTHKEYKDEGKRTRDFYMLVAEDLIIQAFEELLEERE